LSSKVSAFWGKKRELIRFCRGNEKATEKDVGARRLENMRRYRGGGFGMIIES